MRTYYQGNVSKKVDEGTCQSVPTQAIVNFMKILSANNGETGVLRFAL